MSTLDDQPQPDHATPRYLDDHGNFLAGQPGLNPPVVLDEAATLVGYLDRQRAVFAWKCGGLDADAHLARFEDDMTSEWLQGQGQRPPWNAVNWEQDHDWDWRTAADDTPVELYTRWQDAVLRSRTVIASMMAEGGPEHLAAGIRDDAGNAPTLRYILLNMIEEYARHNGQADLIRESIDGLVGQDPP
jgi:hypothetical protein